MDGLSVDLTAQTEASNAADTALQNNIDTLTGTVNGLGLQIDACNAKIAELQTSLDGNSQVIENLQVKSRKQPPRSFLLLPK